MSASGNAYLPKPAAQARQSARWVPSVQSQSFDDERLRRIPPALCATNRESMQSPATVLNRDLRATETGVAFKTNQTLADSYNPKSNSSRYRHAHRRKGISAPHLIDTCSAQCEKMMIRTPNLHFSEALFCCEVDRLYQDLLVVFRL